MRLYSRDIGSQRRKERGAKVSVAKYIGAALGIALIESHIVSRPIAFLLVPWVIVGCLFAGAPSYFTALWRRTILISVAASAMGYLLARFVLPWK